MSWEPFGFYCGVQSAAFLGAVYSKLGLMEIQLVLNLVRRARLSWYCEQSLSSPSKFCSARRARNVTRSLAFLICITFRHFARVICGKKYDYSQSVPITEEIYVLYCDQQLVHDALRERMLTGNERIKVDALKKVSTGNS